MGIPVDDASGAANSSCLTPSAIRHLLLVVSPCLPIHQGAEETGREREARNERGRKPMHVIVGAVIGRAILDRPIAAVSCSLSACLGVALLLTHQT
jgi:hypothetical protein